MKNGLPRLGGVVDLNFTRATEGRAVIVDHLPSFAQRFFRALEPELSKPQFTHLWSLVLGLVINLRSAKLVHLSAVAPAGGHRTRCAAFLRGSAWDAPALVREAATELLTSMKPRPGEVVYLILDDTRLPKKGKKMGWVSKIWDHKQQKFIKGHVVLTAAIAFRGVVMPWRIELWKPKGHSGPRYRKLTTMAAAMVKALEVPAGVKVRVLFDAFYLCPTVTKACESKGFTFFSVAQRNRNFRTANGKTRKVAGLMPGLIRHRGKNVRMKRSRKTVRLRIASADGHLSRIGKVRMVVSKRPRGPWKKCIAIVTNETGLKARQVVEIYERRWLIEVLFKELAQDLGLGDYQMLQTDGIVHHLHVCCLAHLLLTHHALQGLGEKARKPDERVELPAMSQRLTSLRKRIARENICRIVKGPQHARLRSKLLEHLLPAA
jgi:SRSO17 transposase